MAFDYRHAIGTVLMFLGAASAHAQPITGITYTYDLSTPDRDPGGFPVFVRPHALADGDIDDDSDQSQITTAGMLTDGELGSTVFSDPDFGCCLFDNGTYAGFRADSGIGFAPKPKIDVDLGGEYALNSLTLHYLVEDQPQIYSPRRVPDNTDPIQFNALTVFGSTNGVDFTELGFSNDTNPLFGLDGDVGSGAREVRSLTIPLGESQATHLIIDVRSPWTFIFLGEFVVDGSAVAGLTGDYNNDNKVDAADYVLWRKSGINGQQGYDDWRANFGMMAMAGGGGLGSAAVPEPATLVMFGIGCGLLVSLRRFS